jgi:hypothetical protein
VAVFVELVVLHALIWFNLDFSFIGPLQVIWAIGWSMIVLAALVHLPLRADGRVRHRHDRASTTCLTAWPESGRPPVARAASAAHGLVMAAVRLSGCSIR